ncbi:helicase-associated domain-containing protein [Streptomyces sp. Root264]|uniref:helicase-associated domain-containing protein n=1 Tax=Streptomyces sp. Root264 TaxID=1736503 RepID=UPI00070DABE4|nr:helicase-associated domain-containing protein [Streptomyces sp. Root264]KRD17556.1 DNA-binding protein [Streptomyces sp. Root264]
MSTEDQSAPRSLAEALRARDDASLAALLRARPDLITPVPTDLTQLATRAGTRASVVRALERLDRFVLQTAEALAVAGDPATREELFGLMAGDAGEPAVVAALPAALAALREQALVWGADDRLRLVRTARELLAPSPQHPSPTGLGPSVREATAGMSPGRIQEIVATVGLPSTHDSVSAVGALTALFTHRRKMAALLAGAPAESLEVLERLVWGPPYGQVTADPAARLRWLLDRALLLPTAPGTVVLPREVALHLRRGRAHRAPEPVPPAVEPLVVHAPQVVDATAAGQAYTALATVEELLKEWDEGGPAVLRAGGISVRDLKRTAVALDVAEPVAAFWVELAYAAGLLASDGEADERYAATPEYDEWVERPPAERWARLAEAWLAATRTSGVVGGRDMKERALSALGPGLDRSAAPEVRHRVLTLLAGLPEGGAPDAEAVLARLRWERPLRGAQAGAQGTPGAHGTQAAPGSPGYSGAAQAGAQGDEDLRSRLARWVLAEAELLGVTGRGALSAHGRALLGGAPPAVRAARAAGAAAPAGPGDKLPAHHRAATAVAAPLPPPEQAVAAAAAARLLAPLLPEPLDHVLLQADLTAVAPGPLRRPLADVLSVLADVESKGGATVYRFTPGSVRRALDAGRSASDLHAFLAEHSRTPVPQPLSYLIDDVARRHGHLRVGAASAYVRCDDETILNEILADKRAAGLRLRRLAPTVLAAQADPATLLDGLRALGFAPAAESAEGDVLITRALAHRTPPRTAPEPVPDGPPVPDGTLLTAAIRAVRAGDAAATAPRKATEDAAPLAPGELPRTSSAETLATMQAAVLTGGALWIGYVNAEGSASQRVIAPVRVEGGFVTGYDHTADEVRTYPLHRITGVAELADD